VRKAMILAVPRFMLSHTHNPDECRVVFAAWRGFDSPLRHTSTLASCAEGGHRLWWTVDDESAEGALSQLPPYVAERTEASRVSEVQIP
jgi:hypothetical protein